MPANAPADRRTLVSLAGAVLLVLALSGFAAAFGLHYAGEQHLYSLDALDRQFETLDTARAAQVSFKKQVQEWKNILLRGAEPNDLARYRAAFEAEQRHVDAHLERLRGHSDRVDAQRIDGLRDEHRRLNARYAEAIAAFNPTDPSAAAGVDRAVRGIDRPLTDALDALVAEVNQRVDAMRAEVRQADIERYASLRMLVVASTLVGSALVLILLVASLRGPRR